MTLKRERVKVIKAFRRTLRDKYGIRIDIPTARKILRLRDRAPGELVTQFPEFAQAMRIAPGSYCECCGPEYYNIPYLP